MNVESWTIGVTWNCVANVSECLDSVTIQSRRDLVCLVTDVASCTTGHMPRNPPE